MLDSLLQLRHNRRCGAPAQAPVVRHRHLGSIDWPAGGTMSCCRVAASGVLTHRHGPRRPVARAGDGYGLMTMVPFLPTATKRPLPQAMSCSVSRVAVPWARSQRLPSALYIIMPPSKLTATNRSPFQSIRRSPSLLCTTVPSVPR